MRDDEIQVLGTQQHRKRWTVIGFVGLLLVALTFAAYCMTTRYLKNSTHSTKQVHAQTDEVTFHKKFVDGTPQIRMFIDEGIYDVPLRIIQPVQLEASLETDKNIMANTPDGNNILMVQAMGVRKDNGTPTSGFAIGNQKMSYAKKRIGYCAIQNGTISIGIAYDDSDLDALVEKSGCYFRQYPLVIDGEVCFNEEKGKAYRRALAEEEGFVYIIESVNRESLYDFATAIAGLSVSNAIYLPNNPNYLYAHSAELTYESGAKMDGAYYLVFKQTRKE